MGVFGCLKLCSRYITLAHGSYMADIPMFPLRSDNVHRIFLVFCTFTAMAHTIAIKNRSQFKKKNSKKCKLTQTSVGVGCMGMYTSVGGDVPVPTLWNFIFLSCKELIKRMH